MSDIIRYFIHMQGNNIKTQKFGTSVIKYIFNVGQIINTEV